MKILIGLAIAVGMFAQAPAPSPQQSSSSGGGGGAPSGPAGGVLSGTYPNPGIASSVALPGSPTTTTQSAADNSTKVSTTAYADAAAAARAPATAGTCAWTLSASAQTLPLTQLTCATVGGVATAVATGSAPFLTQSINGNNFATVTFTFPDWTQTAGSHNISFLQGGATLTSTINWPTTVPALVSKNVYQALGQTTFFKIDFDGTNYNASLQGNTSGVGFGAAYVAAPACANPNLNAFNIWPDSTDKDIEFCNDTGIGFAYFRKGVDANPVTGQVTVTHLAAALPLNQGGTNGTDAANNGGIVWSNATGYKILAGTATAGQILLSGSTGAPQWSPYSFPLTIAAHQVIVATGTTTAVAKTLPDCVDSGGQHLNFTQSTDAFSCGTSGGGGGGTGTSVVNKTAVTVNANSTSPQVLQQISLTAGYLNTASASFNFHASGVDTIGAAQIPTLTFTANLCTVSGCGSGTVIPLATMTTAATIAATADSWIMNFKIVTDTSGASGKVTTKGALFTDIGATPGSAANTYLDSNSATSSAIDLTAALFIQVTVTTSVGSATNSITEMLEVIDPQVGATVSSFNSRTGAVSPTSGDYTCAQVTNCVVTAPPQFSASNNAITYPALPNSYTDDPNAPYIKNFGIRRYSYTMQSGNGVNQSTFGDVATAAGSPSGVGPTSLMPASLQIAVANGSAVGYSWSTNHRIGRSVGLRLTCMTFNLTVKTALRFVGCGVTDTTLAILMAADIPAHHNSAYIVFSSTGTYTGLTDTTHYVFCVDNATTQTCVSTGVTGNVADTQPHKFEIFEDVPNGQWTAWVDGLGGVSINTNLPNSVNVMPFYGSWGIGAASGTFGLVMHFFNEAWF